MNRFVSIILIISVLQCTFSCTSGNCCAIDSHTTTVAKSAKSCCSHCRQTADSASQSSDHSKSTTPDEHNNDQNTDSCFCQGACAGMVRSNNVELKAVTNSVLHSLIVELLVLRGCSGLESPAIVDGFPNPKTAHGLSMRVRVCSLTC